MMKKSLAVILIFGLLITSCKKKKEYNYLSANEWKVVKIKIQGDSIYSIADEDYFFEFTADKNFVLKFCDFREIFGIYKIENIGNVFFEYQCQLDRIGHCPEFLRNLVDILPYMTQYYEKDNELFFEGEGEIILRKYIE